MTNSNAAIAIERAREGRRCSEKSSGRPARIAPGGRINHLVLAEI
jgi:hypothetical protein